MCEFLSLYNDAETEKKNKMKKQLNYKHKHQHTQEYCTHMLEHILVEELKEETAPSIDVKLQCH